MFTSRAEYRILLRQDNADVRLTGIGHAIGLASDEAVAKVEAKVAGTLELIKALRKEGVTPEIANPYLLSIGSAAIVQQVKLSSVLLRPHVTIEDVLNISVGCKVVAERLRMVDPEILLQAEILLKYEGYIEREQEVAKKMSRMENLVVPDHVDYSLLLSISTEARQKLTQIKPTTIGQASRVSGVSPSDIAVLMIHVNR